MESIVRMNFISKFLIFLMILWPIFLFTVYFFLNGSLVGIFSLVLILITIEVAIFALFLVEKEDEVEEYQEYEY